MLQQAGGVLVVALADEHRVHAVVLVGVHLFQNFGQHAGLAARLVEKVDAPVVGAAAQHAHVQPPGNKAYDLAHAAVFGQVVKAGQRKQDMRRLGKFLQRKADVVKVEPFADQLVGQLGGIAQRAAAAQRVQNKDLLFGVFVQHHLPGRKRRVVAARKIAADRDRNDLVGLQKVFGPFFGAGAGAGAGAVVIGHGLQHLRHVQRWQVHIFARANADLERGQGKLHARGRVFQSPDLTGSIAYDHPRHRAVPPFIRLFTGFLPLL